MFALRAYAIRPNGATTKSSWVQAGIATRTEDTHLRGFARKALTCCKRAAMRFVS
jgi:hypothetical protein